MFKTSYFEMDQISLSGLCADIYIKKTDMTDNNQRGTLNYMLLTAT